MKKFSLFLSAMLISMMSFAAEQTATLSFANKAQRTVFTTSQQVWEQNGLVLTNDKASSTSSVADYANPARFYKGSKLTLKCTLGNVKQVVFDCNSASYATSLGKSIGAGATVSSDKVTVVLDGTTDTYTIATLSDGQVRMDALTVTYEEATSNPDAVKYTVTANVNDPAMGSVDGAGEYEEGKTATLTANANAGYKFVNWSNGSTDNPLKITVTEDVEITANFEAIPPMSCAEAAAAPSGTSVVLNPFDVVAVVKGAGYIYIKDESGVNLIYDYDLDDKLKAGDHVEGFVGVSSPYSGLPELKPSVTFADLTVTPGIAPEPTVFTEAPVKADVNKYVKFEGVSLSANVSFTTSSATNATMVVNGTNVTLRNSFKLAATLSKDKTYDIVGFVAIYNSNIQVYFLSATEIVPPVEETVYFVNAQNWGAVNAYVWDAEGNNGGAWPGVAATKEAEQIGGYDVYSYTAEAGAFVNVIFNDGSGTQTSDLVWTAGKYYVIDGWYTKEEAEAKLAAPIADIWTVAGAPATVFGTEWDPANAANNMTLQEDGTYKWEKTDLTLAACNLQFKVAKNNSWTEAYPGGNYDLAIAEAGIYTITITFNADTKEVVGTATKTGSAVVIPTIAIAGDMNGWNTTANEFVVAEDELTATLTLNLEAQDYGFKMIIAGGWTSDGATITRENNTVVFTGANGDNSTLTADVAGEYTFTWTYATNTLVVTYPEKPAIEWIEMPLEISNLTTMEMPVEGVTYLQLTGRDDMNDADVMLFLNNYTGEEKAYEVNVENSFMTFGGMELTVMDGSITKSVDPELGDVYAGIVHASVEEDGVAMYVAFDLKMYALAPIAIELEDVEIVVNEESAIAFFNATWEDSPLQVEVSGFEEVEFKEYPECWLSIGDDVNWVDAAAGPAAIIIEDGVAMLEGEFTSFSTGKTYEVMLSGKLPVKEEPVVEPVYEENKLNPFAFGLESELNDTALTVTYRLNNSNATSVDVVVYNGEEVVATVPGTTTIGVNVVEVATANLPTGVELTWGVVVKGTSVEAPTQEEKMYSLYCPHGLAIDKDPESEYFGRILVADAMNVVKDKAGYLGSGIGAGLHAFNPSFTTDSTVYTGGNDFTRILASNGYQPWRVKISEDGRIFVSSLDLNGVAVWEVSKDLQTWTPVIAGTNDATDYNIYDADSNFVAGPNCSMDVIGKGEDLKLLLYSTNNKGIAFNQSGYRLDEYALGTATTWSGTPTNIINGGAYGVVHTNVEFIYDGEGGYWFGGSRAGNAGQPNLVHINAAGEQDYYTEDAGLYGGDGVLVHNGMLFKGKARTSGTVGNFGVWTIGKDADGKVTLTEKWSVVANGIGRNLNEFAVDYAENLYVVGNSGEKIIAYALPYSGEVTTPAASQYGFKLASKPTVVTEMVGVVKRALQDGETTIVLTHEEDGAAHIYSVVDGTITELVQDGVIARDPENAGDLLAISDIALTEDGKLVAVNQMICQSGDEYVDAGYKRGENRFYIWNSLEEAPAVWFKSNMYANWFRSNNGQTMAIKGTSANAEIALTGYHATKNWARIATYKVIDGVYTEPADAATGNDNYTWCEGPAAGDIDDNVIGTTYELNASPLAAANWIIDGNLVDPIEYVAPAEIKAVISTVTPLAVDLGKKYQGTSIVAYGEKVLMVAPYATAEGLLAGVKVLDITAGLATATEFAVVDLAAAVEATAAATAVKVVEGGLVINLVADATLNTLTWYEPIPTVGVVKRAVTVGDYTVVLTHEENGAAHLYKVVDGVAVAELSQEGVIAVDLENAGDFLAISDIAATEDGKLVATNKIVCQASDNEVDAGYKRGELRAYIWNDLAGAPALWFTSKMSSNWYRSIQGHTIAYKGTSTNGTLFTTGVTATGVKFRYSVYNVIDGVYTDPAVNDSEHFHFTKGSAQTTDVLGANYQLVASPLAATNWILDGELVEPFEIVDPLTFNTEVTANAPLAADLGKKYNGASVVTVGEQVLMVAPYATAEGLLAGVKVLDITAGLDAATEVATADLDAAVEATAAATAVAVAENVLTITLVADATLHTFEVVLEEKIDYMLIEDNITNLVIDLESMAIIGGPSTMWQVEVFLGLGQDNGDGTFTLTEESSVAIMGFDARFIDGYAYDIDVTAPAAKAVLHVEDSGFFYEIKLDMTSTPQEAVVIVIENALVQVDTIPLFGDAVDYALKMSANWTNEADGVTYPVLVEVPVYYPEATEPSEMTCTVTVGGEGDNDPWLGFGEGPLTITTEGDIVTAKGIVSNPYTGVAFDITISGPLPIISGTENVKVNSKPVKMIKNGQLIIIKNDKEYNVLGATVK